MFLRVFFKILCLSAGSPSLTTINSHAGQIFSPTDREKPAVLYRSSAEPKSSVARAAHCGHV